MHHVTPKFHRGHECLPLICALDKQSGVQVRSPLIEKDLHLVAVLFCVFHIEQFGELLGACAGVGAEMESVAFFATSAACCTCAAAMAAFFPSRDSWPQHLSLRRLPVFRSLGCRAPLCFDAIEKVRRLLEILQCRN